MNKYVLDNLDKFFKANIHIPNLIGVSTIHKFKSLPEMIEYEYRNRLEIDKSL